MLKLRIYCRVVVSISATGSLLLSLPRSRYFDTAHLNSFCGFYLTQTLNVELPELGAIIGTLRA